MGAYISLSSEIGGMVLIGAWGLKGKNTVSLLISDSVISGVPQISTLATHLVSPGLSVDKALQEHVI